MTTELLTDDDVAALTEVFESNATRFTDLVRTAGLNPAEDLRHMALRRIVLQPGEDLTGYDFSGSDLGGAVFRRVDVSGAVFTDAVMVDADFRGAAGRDDALDGDQKAQALATPLPPALQYGPNHLWPDELAEEIERLLAGAEDHYALYSLALETLEKKRPILAEALFQCVLDWREEVLETDSLPTLNACFFVARAALEQGRALEAEGLFRSLLPIDERVRGAEDPGTLVTRHYIARALLDQGRASEAEGLFRSLLSIEEHVRGAEDPGTLVTRHYVARAVLDQGRASEAEGLFRSLLPIDERVNGLAHDNTRATCLKLLQSLLEQNLDARAAELFADLPDDGGNSLPRWKAHAFLMRGWLADLQGDADKAQSYLDKATAQVADLAPEHHARKELKRYLETRVPGGAGGTLLWTPEARGEEVRVP